MNIAYYALHYGSDYLTHSIRSIYNFVDEIHILYTDKPSHGHSSTMTNPDSREKLKAAAAAGDPKGKVVWHEGHWSGEGQQRDTIFEIADKKNVERILVVDADEIWHEDTIRQAYKEGDEKGARNNLIRMLTFWRSFSWVCTDEMMPVRLIYPKRATLRNATTNYLPGRVNHFGYARSVNEIAYKLSCHGHKAEWRNEWFERYKNWPASGNNDLHPTCRDTWNATKYDKNLLPSCMRDHPYWNLEVIP
jgi:hypothetical protein